MTARASISAALLALLATAGPAAAQTLTGTVVEEGSEEPVSGAIVSLLDASDDDRGAVLTGPRGEYEIGAPRPGRYRLRVERIGYRTVRTETVALDRGVRVARRIVVPLEAIEISAIEVEVEDRCATRPDVAETLGVVWEEARKALEATRLTRRRAPHRFEIERIERLLDPRTRLVLAERVVEEEALGRSPFRTRPPEEVTAEGWATMEAQRMQYYGPDVEALLSDDFLDRHCFRLARERSDRYRVRTGRSRLPSRDPGHPLDRRRYQGAEDPGVRLRRVAVRGDGIPRRRHGRLRPPGRRPVDHSTVAPPGPRDRAPGRRAPREGNRGVRSEGEARGGRELGRLETLDGGMAG